MFLFLLNSVFLGVALAMDAFSLSVANALSDKNIRLNKILLFSGTFAFFQFIMPMAGWFCVHSIISIFNRVLKFIPWISFFILLALGLKMIIESVRGGDDISVEEGNSAENARNSAPEETAAPALSGDLPSLAVKPGFFRVLIIPLLLQGIATSLDALSVGFTIADYSASLALVCSLIIAAVTFVICAFGFFLGKKAAHIKNLKAEILGGIILILIGIEKNML